MTIMLFYLTITAIVLLVAVKLLMALFSIKIVPITAKDMEDVERQLQELRDRKEKA